MLVKCTMLETIYCNSKIKNQCQKLQNNFPNLAVYLIL
jgi:hypothetical protein